jgi:hypothetical protein
MGRPYNTHGRKPRCIQEFDGKGKRLLERFRCRWDDNIEMDLKEIGWSWHGLHLAGSEYGPVEDSCEHGNEPPDSIKCWEILE